MKDQQITAQMLKMASTLAKKPGAETSAKRSFQANVRDFRECVALVKESNQKSAYEMSRVAGRDIPRELLDTFPGMARMQMKSHMDAIVKARQEAAIIVKQYESVINQLKDLEAEEKKNVALLKKAAAQVREKGRFLVETENAMIEFTAYLQDKRPGIMQMLGDPEKTEVGEKAGALIERIAAKLGDDVADAVDSIYRETFADLTHVADAMRGFKVVNKTSSLREVVKEAKLREAGLSDYVTVVKDWLSGAADSATKRVMNFAGDIKRWLKGFVTRTKIVKKNRDTVVKGLDNFTKQIDKLLV
jgi:hypothetical protein